MIYSVWNQGAKRYDYYEDGKVYDRVNAPKPRLPDKPLGVVAAKAVWPLPSSAKLTGHGDLAKGLVASKKSVSGLGSFEFGGNTMTILLLAGVAFVLWKSKVLS